MEATGSTQVPQPDMPGSQPHTPNAISVISVSSKTNQGDQVAAPAITTERRRVLSEGIPLVSIPTNLNGPQLASFNFYGDTPAGIVLTSASQPITSKNTITTTVYACQININCSSNCKTYLRETASLASDETNIIDNNIAGTTKLPEEKSYQCDAVGKDCIFMEGDEKMSGEANHVAILPKLSHCLNNSPPGGNKHNSGSTKLLNTQKMTKTWVNTLTGPATNAGWGIPKGFGLRGGGENSLNTGTSGWGTPPAGGGGGGGGGSGWGASPPGPTQGQWGSANRSPAQPGANSNSAGGEFNAQNKNAGATPGQSGQGATAGASGGPNGTAGAAGGQPSSTPAGATGATGNTSWAQAAGKGLPQGNPPTPAAQSTASKQMEQLTSMREALFSQDGWGGQHVNQDTSWDTPGSPEPGGKGDPTGGAAAAPLWKQNVNNGTDLWEMNLRNGGQPPVQPQNKTPWGHTPTTNIGGTWGEEDETNESCNVWTGVPGNNPGMGAGGPWPANPAGPWPGAEKKPEWPSGPGGGPAGVPGAAAAAGANWSDPRSAVPMDPREAINRDMLPMNDMGLMRMRNAEGGVMRGDPRGVSGRLNNTEQMWAAHQPPPAGKLGPGLPPGGNQWSGGLPKEMAGIVGNPAGKPTGWEEPSPPAQRRNIPNYDDGTSLWGQQPQNRLQPNAPGVAPNKNLTHWKDGLPGNGMGRGNLPCPPGMPGATRMPSAAAGLKPGETPVWGQGRNGAWDSHDGAGGWGEENKVPGNWSGEQPLTPPNWPGGKPAGKQAWGEDAADGGGAWGQPSMQRATMPKLTNEYIYSSKQYRLLCDMNYKKEDVESALRSTNMNLSEAIDLLSGWNRRDEQHPFDQNPVLRSAGFNPVQTLGFGSGGPGNAGNNPVASGLLNNQSLAINNMKLMPQTQPGGQLGGALVGQSRANSAQPSAQQLKILVQQIQLAVQAGFLNQQILNQPLAPSTLLLLNQLLQQIKLLQTLNQKQHYLSTSGQLKANAQLQANLNMQLAKTKQSIQNYQSQINSQQAAYMKQGQQLVPHGESPADLFKQSFPDPLSNFPDLAITEKTPPQSSFQTQAQSRLTQWKLPSLEKESEASEFSRAPGSAKSHSSNLNPLLGQGSEAWSPVGRSTESGWPDSTTGDITGDKDSQWPTSQAQANSFADIIPEFEPGKPWKGTQMKSVEDDPSMTPGSVARTPLSLGPIKDTDILTENSKASPGPAVSGDSSVLTSLGLSNSPWTSINSGNIYTSSPLSKIGSSTKSWGDSSSSQISESWLAPGKNARGGPPPGLGSKLGSQSQPNWGDTATGPAGSRSSWGSSPSNWGSQWLILRNLTPQIDGSTLKTLCLQHGPLHNFHLYLHVGAAFAKYSTREEASKAQQALNNCVLGNTSIFAESPGESEVATLLNQLGHSQSQNSQQPGSWNVRGQSSAPTKPNDTWGTSAGSLPGYAGTGNLWQSNPPGSSLWGSDAESHRNTPSGASLNSFLPPDLLNGENM